MAELKAEKNNKMTNKIFTANELKDYILEKRKTNPKYLAYCEVEKFYDIPKGTRLYFGIYDGICGNYISTYDEDTDYKNKNFKFDYGHYYSWHDYYKGKFILIEEEVEVKESEIKVLEEIKIPKVIEYKDRRYVLEREK